jgi:hypothetical protein
MSTEKEELWEDVVRCSSFVARQVDVSKEEEEG